MKWSKSILREKKKNPRKSARRNENLTGKRGRVTRVQKTLHFSGLKIKTVQPLGSLGEADETAFPSTVF